MKIYPASHESDHKLHYFDSADTVKLLKVLDGSAWHFHEPFEIEGKVKGLQVKDTSWAEREYQIEFEEEYLE